MGGVEVGFVSSHFWFQVTDDHIYLVVNAGCRDKDLAHLGKHLKPFQDAGKAVGWHIHDERSLLALQGPMSGEVLQALTKEDLSKMYFSDFKIMDINGSECFLTRTGYVLPLVKSLPAQEFLLVELNSGISVLMKHPVRLVAVLVFPSFDFRDQSMDAQ